TGPAHPTNPRRDIPASAHHGKLPQPWTNSPLEIVQQFSALLRILIFTAGFLFARDPRDFHRTRSSPYRRNISYRSTVAA
ncbi:MAG: hypothetical protein ACXW53_24880, partial [Candidatus Binatia bacterium]